MIRDILDAFGIRQTPWVMRVYLVLLLICVGLMVAAVFRPDAGVTADGGLAGELFEIAKDSFKIVLGAVIGSLSMAAQKQWGGGAAEGGKEENMK